MKVIVMYSEIEFNINKKDLLDGRKYDFSSVENEDSIQVEYSRTLDNSFYFKIWMNGSIIHMVKTYESSMKKVKSLIERYELESETSSY